MNKAHLTVFAALCLLLSSALPVKAMSDDAFNGIVRDLNESVSQVVAAQARRSREAKAAAEAKSKALTCTPVEIDQAYIGLSRCEASIKKAFGEDIRDFKSVLRKGFNREGMSLVLLTTTDAYFYHEDCDICAAVERCSLKDGSLSNFKTAHSVDCYDLAPLLKKNVAYSACPLLP